jgi:hypothetical protein
LVESSKVSYDHHLLLRSAQMGAQHDTQCGKEGQRRKGAVEEEIGKAEQRQLNAKKSRDDRCSDSDRAQRPCVAQQPDDGQPGRERRSELEPIEKGWAAKQVAEQDRFDQLGMEVDRADETEGRLPIRA